MRKRWPIVAAAVAVGAIAALAGTQLASASKSSQTSPAAVSGSITFDGIWTGSEATAFGKVIKAFNQVYPKVKINYKPVGNNVPTVLRRYLGACHRSENAPVARTPRRVLSVALAKIPRASYSLLFDRKTSVSPGCVSMVTTPCSSGVTEAQLPLPI